MSVNEEIESVDDEDSAVVVETRTPSARGRPPWYVYFGDFFNTVKAFIGTNYQGLPFAFAQSGLAFGVVGVFIIATLTDHCICLLIKCKYMIINNIIHEESSKRPTSAEYLSDRRTVLEKGLGYGDVGKIALGKAGKVVIDIAVWYTQLTSAICYFIFIGNATVNLFPLVPALVPLNGSTIDNGSIYGNPGCTHEGYNNLIFKKPPENYISCIMDPAGFDLGQTLQYSTNNSGTTENILFNGNATLPFTSAISNSSTTPSVTKMSTMPPTPDIVMKPTHPPLKYLVMIPLPLFLIVALIRNMRLISPFSVIATVTLFLGAFAVIVFLAWGFKIEHHIDLIKWATLPLFIGQISGAYEGIGCILPIEGSMEGNRHVFPVFLHAAVYLVFVILCSFGVLGYLRYGDKVNQLIIMSLGIQGVYAMIVNVTLIISVACTFPLQFYPAVQIVESYLFSEGALFGPKKKNKSRSGSESDPLLPQVEEDSDKDDLTSVSNVIPESVAIWKRNVVRIIMVLASMGLAVVLRNNYAYLSSLTGALGASFLAFIVPCAVHLKLGWNTNSRLSIIKDITIIVVSIGCSIATIVVFTKKLIDGEVKV